MHRTCRLPGDLSASVLCWLVICLGGGITWADETSQKGDTPAIDFATQIRPLLSDRCFLCHGPDAGSRASDLRLDDEAIAKHLAIVEGEPDESELIARITSSDPDTRMPPADSNLSLNAEEIALLKAWIEQGAKYDQHWSFAPIGKPEVPEDPRDAWSRTPLDHFIWQKLDQKGLRPNDEANRETLIRRVTFDLTGLPPTLTEIDQFLADEKPDAYERLVDRLLASSAYGERMAADWLDVARYSDTYGYQVDRNRFVWPWRDWVVESFNQNKPYDQFIIEQIAGDMLPDATDQTRLATTFSRLHPQKVEGGSVPEEFRVEYVADRAQTVGTAFLGLTMECARCHDHKYDPISQREFYEFFAFFNNIDEAGLYSFFTDSIPTPTLLLADDQQKQQLAALDQKVEKWEIMARERTIDPMTEADFTKWIQSKLNITNIKSIEHLDFEGDISAPNQQVPGKRGQAIQLTGDDAVNLQQGNFDREQPFTVGLWLKTPDVKDRAVVFHRSRAWTDAASRGYELLIDEGHLQWSLIHYWPGNAISIRAKQPLPVDQWVHVAVTNDGSSRAEGLGLFVNGQPVDVEIVRDGLTKNITGGGNDHVTIGERFRDRGFTDGLVDEFELFDHQLSRLEIAWLAENQPTTESLKTRFEAADPETQMQYYLLRHDREYREFQAELKAARKLRDEAYNRATEIMVMQELPQPKPAYLLERGSYELLGDEVSPTTLAALPPMPAELPRNRLGLAQWMTSTDNPLTARVTVNRYWQLLLGEGLVRTPEDFGSQGQPPTHPDLLDYLAHDFREHGWDLKRLVKQIVTSSVYRQSSASTPESVANDPENRLLGRAGRYRLSAEMVRDQALAVSGLLVDKMGGPPVKPYELELAFKPLTPDKGEGLYRRSLYTFWQRNGPAPAMLTMDSAKRDVCQVKRERTSSPLQALILLNGTQYVEAAKWLAYRVDQEVTEDGKATAALTRIFRTMTSRHPTAEELKVLSTLYQQQREYFQAEPQRAADYLDHGETKLPAIPDTIRIAALTSVANALMNFDACVTRR
ncbi:MAG: DUF1553 domain-containing protein [Pirellulaceae bacterium]